MFIPVRRSPCDEPPEESPNGLPCEACPLNLIEGPCPPLPSRIPYPSQHGQKRSDRQNIFSICHCPPAYINSRVYQRPIGCNGCRGCGAVIQPRPGTNVAPLQPLPHWDSVSKGSEEERCN